jgi:hypothetical protein
MSSAASYGERRIIECLGHSMRRRRTYRKAERVFQTCSECSHTSCSFVSVSWLIAVCLLGGDVMGEMGTVMEWKGEEEFCCSFCVLLVQSFAALCFCLAF